MFGHQTWGDKQLRYGLNTLSGDTGGNK